MHKQLKMVKPKKLSRIEKLYYELIYAVGRHFPGESRHETALKYIRQAEERCCSGVAVENTDIRGEKWETYIY